MVQLGSWFQRVWVCHEGEGMAQFRETREFSRNCSYCGTPGGSKAKTRPIFTSSAPLGTTSGKSAFKACGSHPQVNP